MNYERVYSEPQLAGIFDTVGNVFGSVFEAGKSAGQNPNVASQVTTPFQMTLNALLEYKKSRDLSKLNKALAATGQQPMTAEQAAHASSTASSQLMKWAPWVLVAVLGGALVLMHRD